MDAVLTLVKETMTKNEYGVLVPAKESREVFCQVQSVTRQEFFEAGRNGLNPSFLFTVAAADYDGESVVIFGDDAYGIYRTYIADEDYIELYAERKGGINGR